MVFKPNTNTSIDIKLPIEAANWDSYSVELQLMNDAKNKVPSFNNISMITNSHSAKGFQLVAWNASGTSLSYRIAVTVHVFDAKQSFSVTPIHFTKVTTDPEFTISGCIVNGLATIYCRWVNKGTFGNKAWTGVTLARMDVRSGGESFNVFVDDSLKTGCRIVFCTSWETRFPSAHRMMRPFPQTHGMPAAYRFQLRPSRQRYRSSLWQKAAVLATAVR